MTDAERDPLLRRALDELRRLPSVEPDAVGRVVSAAAAARLASPDDDTQIAPPVGRRGRVWKIAGIAAAAAFVGFVARGLLGTRDSSVPNASNTRGVAGAALASARPVALEDEALPILRQFVLNDRAAHRVSVVGDFNQWNASRASMTRSADGLWSVTIPIMPGRHTYGFMIDDSVFTLDPAAPKTRDPDLGAQASIVIVGRP